jgi:hypothetical protein
LGGLDQKTNKFSGGDCTIWGGSKTFNHSSLSLPSLLYQIKANCQQKNSQKKHKSHKKTAAGRQCQQKQAKISPFVISVFFSAPK